MVLFFTQAVAQTFIFQPVIIPAGKKLTLLLQDYSITLWPATAVKKPHLGVPQVTIKIPSPSMGSNRHKTPTVTKVQKYDLDNGTPALD